MAANSRGKAVTIPMAVDKETKNWMRFAAAQEDQPIKTIYLTKDSVKDLGSPDKITVSITPE